MMDRGAPLAARGRDGNATAAPPADAQDAGAPHALGSAAAVACGVALAAALGVALLRAWTLRRLRP